MASSQFASPLIDQTVHAFNGDVTAISPLDGLSLINNWISALQTGTDTAHPVVATLHELTVQLQSGTPDGDQITALLQDLANETNQAAESVDGVDQRAALTKLAAAIGSFGDQLAGKRGLAHTGGNADSGPTVGGISSNENRSSYTNDAGQSDRVGGNGISGGQSDEKTGASATGRSGASV